MPIASLIVSILAILIAGASAWYARKQYLYARGRDQVRLKLECVMEQHPPDGPDHYIVTVTNIGSADAPLLEAGVIDTDNHKHPAIAPLPAGSMTRWLPAFHVTLKPHESKRACVPVNRRKAINPHNPLNIDYPNPLTEPEFVAPIAYVTPQDGVDQKVVVDLGKVATLRATT